MLQLTTTSGLTKRELYHPHPWNHFPDAERNSTHAGLRERKSFGVTTKVYVAPSSMTSSTSCFNTCSCVELRVKRTSVLRPSMSASTRRVSSICSVAENTKAHRVPLGCSTARDPHDDVLQSVGQQSENLHTFFYVQPLRISLS